MHMYDQHHVVPNGSGWAVRRGGSKRASATADTKAEAIEKGREISRNQHSELFIHNLDGKISQRDSHGNDPYPPKG